MKSSQYIDNTNSMLSITKVKRNEKKIREHNMIDFSLKLLKLSYAWTPVKKTEMLITVSIKLKKN